MEVRNRAKYEKTNFCSRKCQGEYRSKFCTGEKAANYRGRTATILCANCGRETKKAKRFVERFEKSFCDRNCQIEYYRQHTEQVSGKNSPRWRKITKSCEWCRKTYETWPSTKDETRFCSMECRNNWQSEMMSGENHYNWNGGTTVERSLDMASREYKQWRTAVFERDGYTCQKCGDRKGGNLRAHHIKSWIEFPEQRHSVENGVTLCENCHKEEHGKVGDTVRTAG